MLLIGTLAFILLGLLLIVFLFFRPCGNDKAYVVDGPARRDAGGSGLRGCAGVSSLWCVVVVVFFAFVFASWLG